MYTSFFENFLYTLSGNQYYFQTVRFLGDLLIGAFVILTVYNARRIVLYKEQKLLLIILFAVIAVLSAIWNQLSIVHLFLGLRSLLRYYIVYFLSFYYDLSHRDFNNLADFLISSFCIQFALFLVYYFTLGTTLVLNHKYLALAIYLNTIVSLILYRQDFRPGYIFVLLLIVFEAFFSTSRLALVGIGLQSIIFLVTIWRKHPAERVASIAAFACISFLLLFQPIVIERIMDSRSFEKFSDLKFEVSPDDNFRLFLADYFTRYSLSHKNILGEGPNTFGSLYTREYNKEYYYRWGLDDRTLRFAADSDYTVLLMQYGIIGMLFYYIIVFAFFGITHSRYWSFSLLYLCFIFLASFAIPVFSMRISSFLMFTFFAFIHSTEAAQ